MARLFRNLVSQNKVRLQQDGYDLDLTYLTNDIIAMGLPASGKESLYRNPIDEVVRFLEERHAERYKVFNLCNERTYDISKFGAACAAFPFDDHGAPPLALVSAFCASCKAWLLQGLDHVVAVHCKAGKGRTGLMVSCLLMHLGHEKSASEAIAFYNKRRTHDGRGLTVPSQRRYVFYYERLLRGESTETGPRTLSAVQVSNVPAGMMTLLVTVQEQAGGAGPQTLPVDLEAVVGDSAKLRCSMTVRDDIRVSLAVPDDKGGTELCRLWINVCLEPDEACFSLHKEKLLSEIDVVSKGSLPTGFAITLFFDARREGDGKAPSAETPSSPSPAPTAPPVPSPALSAASQRCATSSRDAAHPIACPEPEPAAPPDPQPIASPEHAPAAACPNPGPADESPNSKAAV